MDTVLARPASLHLEATALKAAFDRKPFAFTHDLHRLVQFRGDGLQRLAAAYEGRPADYYVSGSAPTPGTVFYDVPTVTSGPVDALARMQATPTRLLLKRPERYDPAFAALLDDLFDQVVSAHGSLRREHVLRLESAILITSAAATTPFHFDPEVGFFSQIEGQKTYHIYAPEDLADTELERFYRAPRVDIGQVDIARRAPAMEHVFNLVPGQGLHQPQNAPHWVQTHGTRSVSYTFVFETRESRQYSRARGFNHYLRRIGFSPSPPGVFPARDAAKSRAMQVVSRARRTLGHTA